ncbi:unnamed protein product [Mucor circinelloides]
MNSTLTPQRRQEISNGTNEHSASARTNSVQMESSKQKKPRKRRKRTRPNKKKQTMLNGIENQNKLNMERQPKHNS